ncbi:MAG TPA: universal stress protein [Polyangiaceae bacterium]|jgi:nucleotide-binding universal stress UspA family protein|nr:universal stress protein [Polyangiaceae bacterium]
MTAPIGTEPNAALRRASALTDILGAELVLLRTAVDAGRIDAHPGDGELEEEEWQTPVSTTRRWCGKVLGEGTPSYPVVVSHREIATAIVETAQRLGASLIVVPHTRNGALIRRIVRKTGIPLLIARRTRGNFTVVAATDLSDPEYPVLRAGLRIARGVVAPTVFVYNAAPNLAGEPAPLEGVARELGASGANVVVRWPSAVDAIREVVAQREADLVVVGTHLRRRKDSTRHSSVAARIVDHAVTSVLVVPVSSDE